MGTEHPLSIGETALQKENLKWIKISFSIYLFTFLSIVTLAIYNNNLYFYGFTLPSARGSISLAIYYGLAIVGLAALFNRRFAEILTPFDKLRINGTITIVFIALVVVVQLSSNMVDPLMGDGTMFLYEFHKYFDHRVVDFGIKSPFDIFIKLFSYILDLLQDKTKIDFRVNELSWRINTALGTILFLLFLPRLIKLTTDNIKLASYKFVLIIVLGTMAAYTNFVEFIPLRLAFFILFLVIYFNALQTDKPNPWILFPASFFLIGYYIAFLPILPGLAYLLWKKRSNIKSSIFNWGSAFATSLTIFALLIHFTVGINPFVTQIFSGHETISYTQDNSNMASIFSLMHLADFTNVMFIHSPFILFFTAFVVLSLLLNKNHLKDSIVISLSVISLMYYLEVYVLNSVWGLFADWDIFSYPAILTTLLFLRILELNHESEIEWKKISASIIPLSLGHLIFWILALHSPDYVYQQLVVNNKYPRNEQMWSNSIAKYTVKKQYLTDAVVEDMHQTPEILSVVLYGILSKCDSYKLYYREDSITVDRFLAETIKPLENKLTSLDLANLANFYIKKKGYEDTALDYLRRSEKMYWEENDEHSSEKSISYKVAYSLALYYQMQNRLAASLYYYLLLSPEYLKEKNKSKYESIQILKNKNDYDQSYLEIKQQAFIEIYNNSVRLSKEGKIDTAEMELKIAKLISSNNNLHSRLSNPAE